MSTGWNKNMNTTLTQEMLNNEFLFFFFFAVFDYHQTFLNLSNSRWTLAPADELNLQ